MEPAEYDRLNAEEERHFWFRAVRAIVLDQVRDLLDRPARVLDAGCGAGGLLARMPAAWHTFGVDMSAQALRYTRQRAQAPSVRGDLQALPFASGSFDLAFALDVVEHCDDDRAVVSELARVLKPGGRLVTTVPAFQFLWSAHDVALHHRRRYAKAGLHRLLERDGLSIERLTHFNTLLFPPVALWRLARRLASTSEHPSSDAAALPRPVNELMYRLFSAERLPLRALDLPFGVSLLAVARRF